MELVEIELEYPWNEPSETTLSSSDSFLTGAVTVTAEAVEATEGARSISDGRRIEDADDERSDSNETTDGLRDWSCRDAGRDGPGDLFLGSSGRAVVGGR